MTAATIPDLTERQWQGRVMNYARWHGWLGYHTWDSRRCEPGFPDLVMVRAGRLIFAELKTAGGRLTPEQRVWLDALTAAPGVEAHLWRPADWPAVQRTLTRRPDPS